MGQNCVGECGSTPEIWSGGKALCNLVSQDTTPGGPMSNLCGYVYACYYVGCDAQKKQGSSDRTCTWQGGSSTAHFYVLADTSTNANIPNYISLSCSRNGGKEYDECYVTMNKSVNGVNAIRASGNGGSGVFSLINTNISVTKLQSGKDFCNKHGGQGC